jgi:(p)ppGpp synthase/HD superfamily hydrolase
MKKKELIAKNYSIRLHENANCKYDNKPYETHLKGVVNYIYRFIYLVEEKDIEYIASAGWGHDLLEDTNVSFNDVKRKLGVKTADLIYALTNEKGRTRAERANAKYYKGIRKVKYADFLKVCDRLANVYYSKFKQPSMFGKYKKENSNFEKKLYNPKYHSMFNDLRLLAGLSPISNVERVLLCLRRLFSF